MEYLCHQSSTQGGKHNPTSSGRRKKAGYIQNRIWPWEANNHVYFESSPDSQTEIYSRVGINAASTRWAKPWLPKPQKSERD